MIFSRRRHSRASRTRPNSPAPLILSWVLFPPSMLTWTNAGRRSRRRAAIFLSHETAVAQDGEAEPISAGGKRLQKGYRVFTHARLPAGDVYVSPAKAHCGEEILGLLHYAEEFRESQLNTAICFLGAMAAAKIAAIRDVPLEEKTFRSPWLFGARPDNAVLIIF